MGPMKKLLALLLLLSLNGCALFDVGPGSDQVWYQTPRGNRVLIMDNWITDVVLIEKALLEIDSTRPDVDPRVDPSIIGAPEGIVVVIRPPGPYPFESGQAPSGFAYGHTDIYSYIHCAWKWLEEQDTLLPGLGHEYRHCYTKDPWAGHDKPADEPQCPGDPGTPR